MTLPSFINEIIDKIEVSGFEAFAVGGCVRDFLLKKEPSDWDITTSAEPCDIIEIFSKQRTVPTGIQHGTITVLTEHGSVEVTTYRIDGEYSDFRRPESVIFSKSLKDDLSRRDFTINAMAYNQKSGLIDCFGGQDDLSKRLIRCVGAPQKRFSEDALRIMRALRFGATLDFEIEEDTSKAIFSCRHLLACIAKERISAELSRLIVANNPLDILINYRVIFAEILDFDADAKSDLWEKNVQSVCRTEEILPLRLALLLDGLNEEVSPGRILKNLKYDNKTVSCVKMLASYLNKDMPDDPVSIKKELSHTGAEDFELILKARLAKFPEQASSLNNINEAFKKILTEKQCYTLKDLAVNGTDIQTAFNTKGKETGELLKLLLDAVICEKCENNKNKLMEYINKNLL